MDLTIIPADETIIYNGVSLRLRPWPFDDAEIHAIQWHGTAGEIEFRTIPRPPNEAIDDITELEPYIEAFEAAFSEDDQQAS